MTYNVFGGTLSPAHSINPTVGHNFDEHSKCICLVTWQLQCRVTVFLVHRVQICLLTYLQHICFYPAISLYAVY